MEIFVEQPSRAPGDGREGNFRAGVDEAPQPGQKKIVGTPVETPEETRFSSFVCVAGKIPQAMKKRMDQDDVRAKAIDTRRENEIEMQSVNGAIPSAAGCVQKQPEQELQQMRSRHSR